MQLGGTEDFEAFYREHVDAIFAFARSRTSHEAAKDVVAETFAIAWRRLAEVRPSAPRSWLIGIARNLLANEWRATNRRDALELRIHASRSADCQPSDPGEAVVERATALETFGDLTAPDRELLALVAWSGLSSGEVADVLGCSRATVLMRLHRARRRFATALERVDLARNVEAGDSSAQLAAHHGPRETLT